MERKTIPVTGNIWWGWRTGSKNCTIWGRIPWSRQPCGQGKGRVTDMRRRLQQHLEACAGRRQWSGERLALQGRMVEELQALGYVE